jgi:hypothetical protein
MSTHQSQVFGAWLYDVPTCDPVTEFPPAHGKLLKVIPGRFNSFEDVPILELEDVDPRGYLCIGICKGTTVEATVFS